MAEKKEKNLKKGKKSFALKHWKEFERLSMKIVEDVYQGKSGATFELTPAQHDGGYDGLICFPISTNYSSELYKILLEAKLRSSSKHDLPLSEFSKTIIIAINTIADKVYISTNAYFSAETNRRLKTYSQRTGLEIHTLDICSITSWINEHREQAEKICDINFLNALLTMSHDLKMDQRALVLDTEQQFEDIQILEVVGEKRKQLLYTLEASLSKQNGILCINADEGEGKTVFIENLIQSVKKDYKRIAYLNLNCFSDIREVFIQLLSIAWGIGASEIFQMSEENLEEVTEYLGDSEFPIKSKTTLISLIRQPQEEFVQNRRLHAELLLDYLRIIFTPILKRIRYLFVISNLDSATRNALDFLCSFIKIFSRCSISFIIEVENRDNIDPMNRVSRFVTEIKRESTYIDTVMLPQWGDADAKHFLDINVPWLSDENKRQLISFFGRRPLAISAGARALQNSDLARVLKFSDVEMPSLATQRQFTLGCIDHIVEEFALTSGQAVQCSLILLGLLDGETEINLIEEVALSNGFSSPIVTLSVCPFLRKVGTRIRVLHGTYQNSIQKYEFVTRSFLYKVLTQTIPFLKKYYDDLEYITRKQFLILKITRNFEELRGIWMQLAITHLHRGETESLYEVLKVVYEWWMENTTYYQLNEYEQHWLLFHLTDATLELFGAETAELHCYLNQLDAVLQLSSKMKWPGGSIAVQLAIAETLNLKSRIALGQADYRSMQMYADQGIAILKGITTPEGLYCMGNLWANKALAIKHLDNLQSCVNFLETGKTYLDKVTPFKFCYYTHMSSIYSVKYPNTALSYLKKIKQECDCTLSQLLHTDHNIASMHFALGEYEKAAQISGQVWVRAYENNVPIEEGRSRHLIGCIAWVKNELEDAIEHFTDSYNLFKNHLHRTHLWPPLINLSTLCIETKHELEALYYTNTAAEFLLQFHLDSINHLDMLSEVLPKMYVGVLILLDNYERLRDDAPLKIELLEKINLSELHSAYATFVKTNQLDALLKGTGYLCNGKRILKI